MMNDPEMFFAIGIVFIWLFAFIIGIAITLLVWCRIFSRAGFHWALGLLMRVPVANIIMPLYLAFAQWPIHSELTALRRPPAPPSI